MSAVLGNSAAGGFRLAVGGDAVTILGAAGVGDSADMVVTEGAEAAGDGLATGTDSVAVVVPVVAVLGTCRADSEMVPVMCFIRGSRRLTSGFLAGATAVAVTVS